MAEKVTVMKLKVDLECHKCYKKVKKVLAKFPQIRDEKFDEKQNIVTITVVCCSPEKIRDKLCYKGGGSIKSIEIVDPPKPEKKKDADDKPKAPAPDPPKKKDAAADKPKPKPADEPDKKKDAGDKEKPKDAAPKEKADKPKGDSEKPKGDPEKPKEKPAEAKPAPPPVKIADPVAAYPPAPQPMMVPVGICVTGYEGGPGPCMNGYAGPVMCYDGYYARPVYDSYGGGRPYYVNRCDQYFSDENPAGCTVM